MLLKLLGLPITAPLAGFRFCIDQLVEMAEQELMDDAPVREALLLLTLRLEEGEIDEQEYAVEEAALMRRLREIRAYKERRAREEAGLDAPADNGQPAVISLSGGTLTVELSDALGPPHVAGEANASPESGAP